MLEEILPSTVVVAEAFGDATETVLFPEEEAVILRAVDERRREFATVRMCARQALARLGVPPGSILPGIRGAPVWPAGIVGSMSHCLGYRGTAVARVSDLRGIGVDAEQHDLLPSGVLNLVALPHERGELVELSRAYPEVHWDRLLFSAKESVYKAWFPIMRRWLGFEEAAVSMDPVAGTFTARILSYDQAASLPLSMMSGRWLVRDRLIVTAIALPPVTSKHSALQSFP